MGVLGWVLAGMAIAAIADSSNSEGQCDRGGSCSDRDISEFLRAYNQLYEECAYYFGRGKYNPIKSFALAIKFSYPRNAEPKIQTIVNELYNVVTLRNTFVCHNTFGVGAVPCREYTQFMVDAYNALSSSPDQFIEGYNQFLRYKERKRLGY